MNIQERMDTLLEWLDESRLDDFMDKHGIGLPRRGDETDKPSDQDVYREMPKRVTSKKFPKKDTLGSQGDALDRALKKLKKSGKGQLGPAPASKSRQTPAQKASDQMKAVRHKASGRKTSGEKANAEAEKRNVWW